MALRFKQLYFNKLLLFPLIFLSVLMSAQKKVELDIGYGSYMTDTVSKEYIKRYNWRFNGYKINALKLHLKSNYPGFDTITLINTVLKDTIKLYTRLKPHEKYFLSCIIDYAYTKNNDYILINGPNLKKYPDNYNDIAELNDLIFKRIENGTVQFKGKKLPKNSKIIGTYGYNSGTSAGVRITNRITSFKLEPFSSGIEVFPSYQVIIGNYKNLTDSETKILQKKYETICYLETTNKFKYDQACQITKQFQKFYIRLFENENVLIIYNYKNNKIDLKLR